MFAQVTKIKQHQQGLSTLLKHKQKLQLQGAYPLARLHVIESQLLNHLYVLSDLKNDAPKDYFAGKNLAQVSHLTREEFIKLALENPQYSDIYTLVLQKLNFVNLSNTADTFFTLKASDQLSHYSILKSLPSQWQLEDNKSLRNSIINNKEVLDESATTILFSQSMSESEQNNAMSHTNFNIAYPALVNAYCNNVVDLSDILFRVFAKTDDESHKAKLLALAGLINDPRWDESCLLFCTANPDQCQYVLTHFVYKRALPLFIKLMGQGVTQKPAYAAWLAITARELAKADKIALIEPSASQKVHSGINLDDAEHARQAFALVSGEQLLNGISFTSKNAKQKLKSLAGTVVQRVLAPQFEQQKACALYHVLLSAEQWQTYIKESLSAE